MKNSFMKPLNFLLTIFCLWGLPTGCATYGMDQKIFDGEGFRVSIPNLQTRAVVWGNHAEAVKHASDWLNDEQILVLYRLADNDMGNTAMASRAKAKPQVHMLSAARRVGAPLVIFLHVNEKLVEPHLDPINLDDAIPKTVEVEVRGMNADTRDLVFGSKVWNSEPLIPSDQLVRDLTTFALIKALKEPQSSVPPQQMVHQEVNTREHVRVLPDPMYKEISELSADSSLSESPPISTSNLSAQSNSSRSSEMPQKETQPLVYSSDEDILEAEIEPLYSESPEEVTPAQEDSKGLILGSGALSLLYTPIKVTYAVLGGFFGGFAYMLTGGNAETASTIWDSSLGGTYMIQPEHLRGDESILFMGPSSNTESAP